MLWTTRRFDIDLGQPRVMGIVNVTPDSFSDGGRHAAPDAARAHCNRLVAEGADVLDIGAESTRPGATPPGAEAEWARLAPVLEHAVTLGVPVSVDTSEPDVVRRAIAQGVDIINDVRALRRPGALDAVAAAPRVGVCLMHLHGEPLTMQGAPMAGDAVAQVLAFLHDRLADVAAAGIAAGRVVLDPGIGFGKTPAQNLALLARQPELMAAGRPLLVGWSRKSTLGHVTGRGVDDRLAASVAAAVLAAERGARVLRVHDVAATVDALRICRAASAAAH